MEFSGAPATLLIAAHTHTVLSRSKPTEPGEKPSYINSKRKYGTIIKSMTATRQEGSQGTFWHMEMFTTLPQIYIKQAIYHIYLDICQQHLQKSQPKQIRTQLVRNLAEISQVFSRT